MSYNNITNCLPESLIQEIQKYIDGEYIYIPKKTTERKNWGENTGTRSALNQRNSKIYDEYLQGTTTRELAESYFLSLKSIQRIVLAEKKKTA